MQQAQAVSILGKPVDLAMVCCRAHLTEGRQHHLDADNVRHAVQQLLHDVNSRDACNMLLSLNICCFDAGADLLRDLACSR